VELFDQCLRDDCLGIQYTTARTINKGHGRIEQRTIWATEDVNWFAEGGQWKNLRSLMRVLCERTVEDETSREYHYYISSLPAADPQRLLRYIRSHWSVENQLHWSLDISFGDDDRRTRSGHGAENASRLARIALNLLKAERTLKASIKSKRLMGGWEHDYLLGVLAGPPKENSDA
jgi:predicted transposase YbfD/YdcC